MSTIKQIAAEVGVSPNTVLRVLRQENKEVWPSAIRRGEQIRSLAQRLGYMPNGSARAIRSGRFNAVGLLLSTDEGRSYLPHHLFNGIHDALLEVGMHLTVAKLPDEELTRQGIYPRILKEWCCDGLLINYTDRLPRGFERRVASNNTPCVWINRKRPTDAVYYDDYRGGYEAARHLLSLHHERVMYLDFVDTARHDDDLHYSRADRRAGYIAAMREAGLSPRLGEALVGTPIEARHTALASLLRQADRPTAILGYDAGYRVLYAAALAGLSVPADLSVMSFGELHGPAGQVSRGETDLGPDMTFMGLPTHRLGGAAVSYLLERIEGSTSPRDAEVLPLELMPGTTVAQPPRCVPSLKS